MMSQREAFAFAVRNVATWGDTDVFPFPVDNHIFHDRTDEIVDLLVAMDGDLDGAISSTAPELIPALSLVSYEGLRQVAQVDPLWNAYLLGLVLGVAPQIEAARIPTDEQIVFSYRIDLDVDKASIFGSGAWSSFTERSKKLAEEKPYVVICDIADFYSRVYHHRVENALQLVTSDATPRKINKILGALSGGTSYGLPVGGPAARILSEICLARTDSLLRAKGIVFTRFADDYRLFADTRNEAFNALILLSEALLRHDGLTLVKQKTRVLESKDFVALPAFDGGGPTQGPATPPVNGDELNALEDDVEHQERQLLRLSLKYDPYSPNAVEDYQHLKSELKKLDVVGMLTREVARSRVNPKVAKQLVQAVKYLEPALQATAARTLVESFETLAPALPVTLRVLADVIVDLPSEDQTFICEEIRTAIAREDYYIMVPVNLAYALRVLQHDRSFENVTLCTALFDNSPPFIQSDIIYLMYGWDADFFLSEQRRKWSQQNAWVKRALIITSFALNDEGRYWRTKSKSLFSVYDRVALQWMAARVASGHSEITL